MRIIVLMMLLVLFPLINAVQAEIIPPSNFNRAKTAAMKKIYYDQKTELYCGCAYEMQGRKGVVDLESCGYEARKNETRARRIEWEHVLPISIVGQQMQCWREGGRKNCQKKSPMFNLAEADLHNLFPVVGEVNGDRSNYMYGMVTEKPHQYGACEVVVNFKERRMMPAPETRGIVARITLYMYDRYNMRLSRQDKQLFDAWNKMYPVSSWEIERNQRTACVMGWGNGYVSQVDLSQCS